MLNDKIRYGYNDVMIQPADVSPIEHRSECDPFIDGMLPIFTAPMSTVVNEDNIQTFKENRITPILPRNVDIKKRLEYLFYKEEWVALSLSEFEQYICVPNDLEHKIYVLIDIANGNMKKMFDLAKTAKRYHGSNLVLMAGNIANSETYGKYCECGIDYVRVGIGGGAGCITSSNTGIHDGIVSLLDDIWKIKRYRYVEDLFTTKIVADGGIRGYSDVIKALALGADYVMIGSLLARTVESAAPMYYKEGNMFKCYVSNVVRPCLDDCGYKWVDSEGEHYTTLYKEFYGMASKYGQIDINGEKTKTSEGIKKELEVTTNLDTWVNNMADYLRSAMSYCGVKTLNSFTPRLIMVQVISNNEQNSINR